MKVQFLTSVLLLMFIKSNAQVKILFDATKAETAGNADWIIDADNHNLGYSSSSVYIGGNESNAQQIPSPSQAGITASTSQNYWTGGLSAWGIDIVKLGYVVESLPYNGSITYGNTSNPQDLSNYKVFIVCEPNILFTNSEKTALMNFIQNGGGLFMISDHNNSDRNSDGFDSPTIWNDFIQSNSIQNNAFGFSFDLNYFSNTTSNMANLPADSLLHGSYGNVTQVKISGGTSLTLNQSQNSTVVGVAYRSTYSNSGNTGVLCAHSTYGLGRVVALSDSSPADDGTGDNNDNLYDGWIADANGNHERLIMNATIWLLGNNIVLSNKQLQEKLLQIYASGNTINIKNNLKNAINLNVFNINGQLVIQKENIAKNSSLNLNINKNGIYFYQLTQLNKIIKTGKLLLMKN